MWLPMLYRANNTVSHTRSPPVIADVLPTPPGRSSRRFQVGDVKIGSLRPLRRVICIRDVCQFIFAADYQSTDPGYHAAVAVLPVVDRSTGTRTPVPSPHTGRTGVFPVTDAIRSLFVPRAAGVPEQSHGRVSPEPIVQASDRCRSRTDHLGNHPYN